MAKRPEAIREIFAKHYNPQPIQNDESAKQEPVSEPVVATKTPKQKKLRLKPRKM
jgi:hypothetical protein